MTLKIDPDHMVPIRSDLISIWVRLAPGGAGLQGPAYSQGVLNQDTP